MPTFSRVPVEILTHILNGTFLAEIVNFGQTSSRLYSLVKTERIVWKNSKDVEYLPLPTGHTIQTVPVELLFPIALRACSIALAFQQPVIVPKRCAPVAPLDVKIDAMPYNVAIPGGRWTMYNTDQGIRFHDSSKTPLENDTLMSHGKLLRNAMGTMGGGIVRCVQAISTDSAAPYIPPGTSHVIDVLLPSENIGNVGAKLAPEIYSAPVPIPRINATGVRDVMGSLILSIGGQNFDLLYMCNVESRTGLVLRFTGHNKRWYEIRSAEFFPSLKKIVLEVLAPGSPGYIEPAVWVFDIPDLPFPDPSNASIVPEFLWTDKLINIQSNHEYIKPIHWDTDGPEPLEIPETYVGLHEFTPPSPRFSDKFAMVVLCLKPDDKLEPVFLGWFRCPSYFISPFGKRVIGATCLPENRLEIVCTDPPRRKLLIKVLEIPGEADMQGETMIRSVDLRSAAIHSTMDSFSVIPVEIVIYILKGASYKEIVSIAQTSSRLYVLVKTDPILWKSVVGLEALPFPTGYDLATIPFDMLYPLALRACSIARAFQQPLILPKRHFVIAPCNDEMLEMAPARMIPGGRWTMFSERAPRHQDRTLELLDAEKAQSFRVWDPPSYHLTLPRGDIKAMGGGVVRHVQRLFIERTGNEGPFVAPPGTNIHGIIDICFPMTSDEDQPPVFEPPVLISGLHEWDHTVIEGSLIFAFRGHDYYTAEDSLSLLDSNLDFGIKFTLQGQTQHLYAIYRAEFHPHLPKIILYVSTRNEVGADPIDEQLAIWVIDIPDFAVLSSTLPRTNIGGINWSEMAIEIANQYVIPDDWMEGIQEMDQVPETHTSIHEFTLPSPRFPEDDVVIALCLTPEESLLLGKSSCIAARASKRIKGL
ncbi:hypothetical protein SISNIDRAFT_471795 [Sistotremastrum niveocremeum HHB9708]|uniref:F-box domain-containing protein n=1 Tax=Sistotremastrum niveocremeum HHB9708 TaxID=1314777 RepID=A0A164M7A4_9AGAM|nr:hypothetical protein SISNIDRAFT_471795 [Sistotremastrum niveocremeum HHB9708]